MDFIDRIPVSTLPDRYGIGRTILYERINALNIRPEKDGNRSFINDEQLALLDGLAEHIQNGGTTPSFASALNIRPEQTRRIAHNDEQGEQSEQIIHRGEQPTWLMFAEAIATRLSPSRPDPLEPQRRLQEIADRGWTVTTSQLREILGTAPKQGKRMGFMFMRSGRVGREGGWKVNFLS